MANIVKAVEESLKGGTAGRFLDWATKCGVATKAQKAHLGAMPFGTVALGPGPVIKPGK
jgi:hypothetical protein